MKNLFCKKSWVLLFFFIFVLAFVVAQTNRQVGVPEIAGSVEKLFSALVESFERVDFGFLDSYLEGFILFLEGNDYDVLKIFFGFLLFFIVYGVFESIDFFESYKVLFNVIISAVVSVLAMIALPENFIDFLIPSYQAIGSAIFSAVIFFLFLLITAKVKKIIVARVLWIFVAVYFCVLFFSIGISEFYDGNKVITLVYFAMVVVSIFAIIFIREIRKIVFESQMKDFEEDMNRTDELVDSTKEALLEVGKGMADSVRRTRR